MRKKIFPGLLIIIALMANSVFAETKDNPAVCKVGTAAPAIGFATWPENTRVAVYTITADFGADELAGIAAPLANWNAAGNITGSRVTFSYQGAVDIPQECKYCLTIMRGKIFDKRKLHAAEIQATVLQSEQTILHARIVIDPVIPNLAALTNAVAHELGHNFGLKDCYSCQARTTVMSLIRTGNVLEGPTPCDLAQVRHVYEDLRVRLGRLRKSQQVAAFPVDAGEEPEDDDTPIVVRKP